MVNLDYDGLLPADVDRIERAISEGQLNLTWCIGEKAFGFVLRNYRQLAPIGFLEQSWMEAYLSECHPHRTSLDLLQEVFDACDRSVLQEHYSIPRLPRAEGESERFSLFRGCAGPEHRMGMSWTHSLDKAIWYAAWHAGLPRKLTNLAVYTAAVDRAEIYCCGGRFDVDYIVRPKEWYRVDVPAAAFRVDRVR
jgi:hypothetical protein